MTKETCKHTSVHVTPALSGGLECLGCGASVTTNPAWRAGKPIQVYVTRRAKKACQTK